MSLPDIYLVTNRGTS
jgi:hypothetical protein